MTRGGRSQKVRKFCGRHIWKPSYNVTQFSLWHFTLGFLAKITYPTLYTYGNSCDLWEHIIFRQRGFGPLKKCLSRNISRVSCRFFISEGMMMMPVHNCMLQGTCQFPNSTSRNRLRVKQPNQSQPNHTVRPDALPVLKRSESTILGGQFLLKVQGVPCPRGLGLGWLRFGMFHHPAWVVGSYSSGPPARGNSPNPSQQNPKTPWYILI